MQPAAPIPLEHETSMAIAITIARTKVAFAGPILGDSGLNVIPVGLHHKPYISNQAQSRGALMTFTWGGPIDTGSGAGGYPPDRLQDEHAHRAVVPVGTTKHLKLQSIALIGEASWLDVVQMPQWKIGTTIRWLNSLREEWKEEQAKRIEKEINSIVAQRPSISVHFPPGCIYAQLLRAKYPKHAWPN